MFALLVDPARTWEEWIVLLVTLQILVRCVTDYIVPLDVCLYCQNILPHFHLWWMLSSLVNQRLVYGEERRYFVMLETYIV